MSKTKTILEESGISVAKAAELLGISRAGMYRVLADGNDLTIERWESLYAGLKLDDSVSAKRSVVILNELVEKSFEYSLSEHATSHEITYYERQEPNKADEYWIFAVEPLEMQDLGYLEFMINKEYSQKKFIAYFVGSEDVANRLGSAIDSRQAGLANPFLAKIYIIETNAVWMAPHFSITDPRTSEPKGFVLDQNGSKHMPILGLPIEKVIHTIRNSGIGLPENKGKMFPLKSDTKENSESTYMGFYFKKHYPKENIIPKRK